MTTIEKFAIRHIPTGHYIPEPSGRMGRGGSHVEPVKVEPPLLMSYPRLFATKRGAENCLTQWLRGKHHTVYEYDEFFGREVKTEVGTSVEHLPTRIREDMEVVAIQIHLP